MTMVTEIREAQRLPVLKHEGKVTIVKDGSEGLSATLAVAAEACYEISYAQYHANLSVLIKKPRHRKWNVISRTTESVGLAILDGHDHGLDEISNCTAEHFTPEMFVYANREAAVAQSSQFNSLLSYCRQHQGEVLALELFGWNFFESSYPDEQRRYSCGCENMKKNKPTGIDCLKTIFPDRWQLVENYQKQVRSWRASAAV
jgi:hypothetical protein